jgi:exodeoxyribonuclease V beta subunit
MLKGFIDLVFRHEGRYYLLDYKSNWLGESSEAYTQQAMASAMQMHRYDLQYQLYTLALHRYLRHRIADYRYEAILAALFTCSCAAWMLTTRVPASLARVRLRN